MHGNQSINKLKLLTTVGCIFVGSSLCLKRELRENNGQADRSRQPEGNKGPSRNSEIKNILKERTIMRKHFLGPRILPLLITIAWLVATHSLVLAQDKAAKIDELMKVYNSYQQFNGAVLVAENGKVIFKKGYGMANMEWNIPVETDTRFRLGSITKQFTSMLVLQLVQEGKIKLEGKLTDYLPDYRKETGDRITIHQLLNHTSGIPSYTGLTNFFQDVSRNPYSVSDFVKKFASGDLEFQPGTKFNYNNSGYFLLG